MTIQRSFSAGEISPQLYGRVDVDRWKSALKTCLNFIPTPEGGIATRAGFELQANLGAVTKPRLVPFEFGPSDSYVLLFNGTTMKVMRNGSMVETTPGSGIDYSVACVVNEETMRWVQSGDTIYVTDGTNVPKKIVRGAAAPRDTNWTITDAAMTPDTPATSGSGMVYSTLTATGVTAGTDQIRYRVTRTLADGTESAVFRTAEVTGTSASGSSGNPWVITSAAHGMITNDNVVITEAITVSGTTIYNVGDVVRIVVTGVNTFTVPCPAAGTQYAGNFKYRRIDASSASYVAPTTASPFTISWTSQPGAAFYNVFREYGRVFGYIGSTSNTSFSDYGIIPDIKDVPVIGIDPGKGGHVPTAIGLFQQRLMLGGYDDDVERIVGSHIGNYSAFDPGAEDASGLDFGLAGRTVSAIQHMLEIAGRAVVLTNTAEWTLKGNSGGGLTPTAINARADSYHGCSAIPPALVGSNLIYVHRGEKILLDAVYDFSQEALKSRDLTLWSRHLMVPGISKVVYQRSENLVWVLRNDGVLLGLTYVPDQEVWGWHRHTVTDRTVEDLCVVSEDNVDRLYILTSKEGSYRVCRLPEQRDWENDSIDDWRGFDEALEYDGRNLWGSATVTLTPVVADPTWETREQLTLTASSAIFTDPDSVGRVLNLYIGNESVQVTIDSFSSSTVVVVYPDSIVPESLRSVAASYAVCATTFDDADHLEGETVGVIADGGREANEIVSGGSITLARPFARVHIGLPITADAETLPLEATDKDTMLGNVRHVTRVILNVYRSRGLKAGLTTTALEPMRNEYDNLLNSPPAVQSGAQEIIMTALHDATGEILIRQDTGMPAYVLEARPIFNAGETR